MAKYIVYVEWLASARVEIEAESGDKAEEMVQELGLPWDQAEEAGDGDRTFWDAHREDCAWLAEPEYNRKPCDCD